MKTKQSVRLIAAMLVALIAGSTTTLAKNWNFSKEGVADEGGGTYDFRYDQKNFRYDGKSHWNAEEHIMYFKTQQKFDAPKGNYYYEFEVGGCRMAFRGTASWAASAVPTTA